MVSLKNPGPGPLVSHDLQDEEHEETQLGQILRTSTSFNHQLINQLTGPRWTSRRVKWFLLIPSGYLT